MVRVAPNKPTKKSQVVAPQKPKHDAPEEAKLAGAPEIATAKGELLTHVKGARLGLEGSKSAASLAAAHTYLLWSQTEGPGADTSAHDWLNDQIAKVNETIDKENSSLEFDRLEAEQFKAGTLGKIALLNLETKSTHDQKIVNAARDKLAALAELSDADWDARKKLRIEVGRKGASQFAPVVKYTLQFQSPSQRELVSRYCGVLEWIHDQPDVRSLGDAEAIKDAIHAAGGFEHVLHIQRAKRKGREVTAPTRPRLSLPKDIKLPEGALNLFVVYADNALTVMGFEAIEPDELIGLKNKYPEFSDLLEKIEPKSAATPESVEQDAKKVAA